MNHKFDEVTKGLAQAVTRRQALRRFGVGLGGIVLTSIGLGRASKAVAQSGSYTCCYYNGGTPVCQPPGKHCPQWIWWGGGRYPRTRIPLTSSTPVQDCSVCV